MSKTTKVWLITAASFVLIGCIIFGGVMTMLNWDFTKLSTNDYETNQYEITEDFTNISVTTDTADMVFVPSETSKASVVCYEKKNARHTVAVQNGTLTIKPVDTRKWYEYIGINLGAPKITVSVPQGAYGALVIESSTGDVEIPKEFSFESIDISEDTGSVKSSASASENVKIRTDTGNIQVESLSVGALELSVSTGKITATDIICKGDVRTDVSTGKTVLTNVMCKNLLSEGDTGDISLKNVKAAERFSIERSTGHVTFDGADAANIFVDTDTGDVKGTLLTDKIFITETDTGRIDVPKSTVGGRCEISTDTGDIRLKIAP